MTTPRALLVALALATPPAAGAASQTARLLVTANVVRAVEVRVGGGAAPAVSVRTSGSAGWSAPLSVAARLPGVEVSPCADDRRYVVVTVLADAAPPEPRERRP